MIAININISVLVSLLFPLRPEVSWECHLFGETVKNALPVRLVFASPTLRMMGFF